MVRCYAPPHGLRRHDALIEQPSGQSNGRDTGQFNAYFEQAAVKPRTCRICGAANGPDHCHNCQEQSSAGN